jgi:hypothetical protein
MSDERTADEKRVVELRNALVLWVQGKKLLSLSDLKEYVLELDHLLQQHGL